MLPRPILRLAGALAALGLVGALAVMPAAADTCAAAAATHAEASGGVTLTHSAEFTCADAADAGAWSITVEVANGSDATVAINDATLAGVSPSVHADGDGDATLESSGLPLAISAGESGSFQLGGNYTLAQVGAVALANLHVRASGVSAAAGSPSVTLSINVHLRGPDAELSTGADAHAAVAARAGVEGGTRASEASVGAVALLSAFLRDGLPWEWADFPAALGAAGAAGAEAQAGGTGVDAGAGAAAAGTASGSAGSEHAASDSDAGAQGQARAAEAEAHVEVEVEVGGSSSISLPVLGD